MSSAEGTKSSVTEADKQISQLKHNVGREISSRQEVRVKLSRVFEHNSTPEQGGKESQLPMSSNSLLQFQPFPPQGILQREFL